MKFASDDGCVLVAVASRLEFDAIMPERSCNPWQRVSVRPGLDVVLTGAGKANAAGAIARFADSDNDRTLLNIGIGGSLPGSSLDLGAAVVATRSVFSDEGLLTPSGFTSLDDLGFSPAMQGDGVDGDASLIETATCIGCAPVRIATVSTCSGTNASAEATALRTNASVEAMEGAAVGLVADRLRLRFVEIRVISNTTGDRDGQRWAMDTALRRMRDLFEQIVHA